jgi:hypothetical protein
MIGKLTKDDCYRRTFDNVKLTFLVREMIDVSHSQTSLTDISRNCQNWRRLAEIAKIGGDGSILAFWGNICAQDYAISNVPFRPE